MFKILVLFTGILNSEPVTILLNSNTTYYTMDECKEAMGTDAVRKDILDFAKNLKILGYTDLEVNYDCGNKDTPT